MNKTLKHKNDFCDLQQKLVARALKIVEVCVKHCALFIVYAIHVLVHRHESFFPE